MKLRLKELRKALDLTQKQVADLAGISVSYYTELELGRKQINANRLEGLAKALGTTPKGLIAGSLLERDGLAEAIEQLPPEAKEIVRRLVDLLLGNSSLRRA